MEVIAQDKEAVQAEKVAQQHFGQVEKALQQQLLNLEEDQPQKGGSRGRMTRGISVLSKREQIHGRPALEWRRRSSDSASCSTALALRRRTGSSTLSRRGRVCTSVANMVEEEDPCYQCFERK